MEYCSLGDLSGYIRKRGFISNGPTDPIPNPNLLAGVGGGLNEFVVRHFLKMLASSIDFLRMHNLIHRDLKPQNVLLHPSSSTTPIQIPYPYLNSPTRTHPPLPILKLADFGFARLLPSQSLASTLCGSPLYMAPEILRYERYDAKADLWSLGAVLYECLTGRPPFKAANHVELLRRIEQSHGIKWPVPGASKSKSSHSSSSSSNSSNTRRSSTSNATTTIPTSTLMMSTSPLVITSEINPSHPSAGDGISPGLKDLVERLLKKNPVERMGFEEFFMRPEVEGYWIDRSASSTLLNNSNLPQSPPNEQEEEEGEGEEDNMNQRKESKPNLIPLKFESTQPDIWRRPRSVSDTTQTGRDGANQQPRRDLIVGTAPSNVRSYIQHGSLPNPLVETKFSAGGWDAAKRMEAPFPEYDVDPNVFANLTKMPTTPPKSLVSSPRSEPIAHHSIKIESDPQRRSYNNINKRSDGNDAGNDAGNGNGNGGDEGNSGPMVDSPGSDISSVSSLELSDETAKVDKEYVVVEKRVVEVNWFADDVASLSPRGSQLALPSPPPFPSIIPSSSSSTSPSTIVSTNIPLTTPVTWPPPPIPIPSIPHPLPNTSRRPIQLSRSSSLTPHGHRILGSLRDSTSFLLTGASPPSPIAATSNDISSSNPNIISTVATTIPNSLSTTFSRLSLNSMSTPILLNHLNLLTRRGYAVHQFSDELWNKCSETGQGWEEVGGMYLKVLGMYWEGMEVAKCIWERVNSSGIKGISSNNNSGTSLSASVNLSSLASSKFF